MAVPTLNAASISRLLRKNSVERGVLFLRWALLGACALLLFIAIYQVANSYMAVSAASTSLKNQVDVLLSENTAKPASSRGKKESYEIIAERNIFNVSEIKPTPPPAASAKPVSNLALSLIGTFITTGQSPYAIIEDSKKAEQDVFVVNESIFGDATLKAIFNDHVEIERNGQKEVLMLDDSPAAQSTQTGEGISTTGQNNYVIEEAELDKAMENLPLLLTQARAVPYFQDGKSVGLRLFAIRAGSLFEKLGLTNGDILKTINGNSLGDFTQAMTLFQRLKEERSITLSLERNKQDQQFQYQVR